MDKPRVYNTSLDKLAAGAQIGTRVLCYYGLTTIGLSTLPNSLDNYPHVPSQFSEQRRQPSPSNTVSKSENYTKGRRRNGRRKHATTEIATEPPIPTSVPKEADAETTGAGEMTVDA